MSAPVCPLCGGSGEVNSIRPCYPPLTCALCDLSGHAERRVKERRVLNQTTYDPRFWYGEGKWRVELRVAERRKGEA